MNDRITVPGAEQPRASLVYVTDDGVVRRQDVGRNQSVLNIEHDLIKHLNEQPLSDAWLLQLRDYCNGRLGARAEARAAGRIVFPQGARLEHAEVH